MRKVRLKGGAFFIFLKLPLGPERRYTIKALAYTKLTQVLSLSSHTLL